MMRTLVLLMSVMALLLFGCNGGGSGNSGSKPTPQSAGNNWTNAKFGGGGYVPGLVFHPTTPDLLYARTDIGGAYRWNKDTLSWVAMTDGFGVTEGDYVGAESIALDPNNDYRVYMSTGQYLFIGNGRLYISSDRGDSWTHVELPFPVGSNNSGRAIGERMMVDPNLPSTLFYGSRTAGLWKSTDSGLTWTQVTSLSSAVMTPEQISAVAPRSPAGVQFVVFDTGTIGSGSATQTIYVGVAPHYARVAGLTDKVYRSTDGGDTWVGIETPVDGETNAEGDPRDYYIPHVVRADDGQLYFAFTGGIGPGAPGPGRLYRFDGVNWTLLRSVDPGEGVNFGYGGLSVYGSGSNTKIALGITNSWGEWDGKPVVEFSEDAGVTWREISGGKPHTPDEWVSGWIDDVEINPFNPDHVLHVHGGGVWETFNASDADPSWTEKVDSIEETVPIHLVTPPPGASYTLLNASGDIGTLVHTSLDTKPTRTPTGDLTLANGASVDMAWSDPSYIVTIGTRHWGIDSGAPAGLYSKDGGLTWAAFGSLPEGAGNKLPDENNIAVTSPNNLVWSVANRKPYYSTDNGDSWHETNLPLLGSFSVDRNYHVVADRQNPNKVYAYDHGGDWWGSPGKFYYSIDGGKTFTESTDPNLTLRAGPYSATSMAVNPNAEGDVWLVDGHSVFHSVDSGITWRGLTVTQSIWGDREAWSFPEIYGASSIALGKPASGSDYSAAVYLVGAIGDVWGLFRSDDMGDGWVRINDDAHQFGGISQLAPDNKIHGRVYISGVGRGVIYNY